MTMSDKKRTGYGPLKLGGFLPDITSEALKKRGFAEARMITDWPQIVGVELARYSLPEKLFFSQGKRNDGTLRIKVHSSFATALQHLEPIIIEKISVYFGYRAVGKIKLLQSDQYFGRVQKESPPAHSKKELGTEQKKRLESLLNEVTDPMLKAALEGLGKNMLTKHTSSTKGSL